MRDLRKNPALPPGSYVLWTNPEDRARLRWGVGLLLASAITAGGVAGYAIGRHYSDRRRNLRPRRR